MNEDSSSRSARIDGRRGSEDPLQEYCCILIIQNSTTFEKSKDTETHFYFTKI
jgi:hypothetical protein